MVSVSICKVLSIKMTFQLQFIQVISTFTLRIIIKDILDYITKSGLINSKCFMKLLCYKMTNFFSCFKFTDLISQVFNPNHFFFLNKNYV